MLSESNKRVILNSLRAALLDCEIKQKDAKRAEKHYFASADKSKAADTYHYFKLLNMHRNKLRELKAKKAKLVAAIKEIKYGIN